MTRTAAIPVERYHLLNGWLFSLVLHSLLLCVAISWLRHSSAPMSTDLFQWDVTLVQSAQFQETHAVSPQETAQPNGAMYNPQPAPISRIARTPTSHAPTAFVQPTANKPITAESQAATLSSVAQTVPQTESSFTDPASSLQQTADTTMHHLNPLSNTTAQETSAPATIETSSPSENGPVADPVQPVQTQAMASAQSDAPSPSRADYSWLQRMIFQRLDELKRSSRPQLDEGRPLKVLVKAVVSNDGNLLASEVVRSSGLQHIDQEAVALVQRAFPMQFDRPLDRQQVAMRIPITYSRE